MAVIEFTSLPQLTVAEDNDEITVYDKSAGVLKRMTKAAFLAGISGGNFVPLTRKLSINGTQFDLSADRAWNIQTGGNGGSDDGAAVIDMRDFAVDPTYTNDSTAAINLALQQAWNVKNAVLKFQPGRYACDATATGANRPSALRFPKTRFGVDSPANKDEWRSIMIEGVGSPPVWFYGTVGNPTFPTAGVQFIRTSNSGSLLGVEPDPLGLAWGGLTNVILKNVQFHLKDNSPIAAVDAYYAAQLLAENVIATNGKYAASASEPTNAGNYGFVLPLNNNSAFTRLTNCLFAITRLLQRALLLTDAKRRLNLQELPPRRDKGQLITSRQLGNSIWSFITRMSKPYTAGRKLITSSKTRTTSALP